jgi:cyclopropane-fatty-acyl-phospholipid synthase
MLTRQAISLSERGLLPDAVLRAGIRSLMRERLQEIHAADPAAAAADCDAFVAALRGADVALLTDKANEQHYEVPAEFFGGVLGPHRKYSSCWWPSGVETLESAEAASLAATCERAELVDGQQILELGCGWGSLSLYMAAHYPQSRVTSVSNSHSQRAYIVAQAQARGLSNIEIITADMNVFEAQGLFDRIVSVEMFEHMSNWDSLLRKARGWLKPDGRMFMHVFTHRTQPYRFETDDKEDWIAQHFFTGGIMPSHGLIGRFGDSFSVEEEWRWSGAHYERTALQWLENFDANADAVSKLMVQTYGPDASVWTRRWRLFFLATAGLFGHRGGDEWGVSHYRLKPATL